MKVLVASFSFLAAFALVDSLLIGRSGKGQIATSDGRTGPFEYSASKRTAANGRTTFDGKLRFEQQPNPRASSILVDVALPGKSTQNGNVGEFSGNAILTTVVDGKRVKFGGTVSVHATIR